MSFLDPGAALEAKNDEKRLMQPFPCESFRLPAILLLRSVAQVAVITSKTTWVCGQLWEADMSGAKLKHRKRQTKQAREANHSKEPCIAWPWAKKLQQILHKHNGTPLGFHPKRVDAWCRQAHRAWSRHWLGLRIISHSPIHLPSSGTTWDTVSGEGPRMCLWTLRSPFMHIIAWDIIYRVILNSYFHWWDCLDRVSVQSWKEKAKSWQNKGRTQYYMQLKLPILAQLSRIIAAKILPNLRLFAGSGCYDCFKTHTCKDSNKHYTCMQMYAWICVAIIRQGAVTSLRISGSSSDTPVQEMRQLVENREPLSSWQHQPESTTWPWIAVSHGGHFRWKIRDLHIFKNPKSLKFRVSVVDLIANSSMVKPISRSPPSPDHPKGWNKHWKTYGENTHTATKTWKNWEKKTGSMFS